MPCFHPLDGYRSREGGIVFTRPHAFTDLPIKIPCGQCIGCRLEKSRQWAMRCMHEASLYEDNCFITLTYNDDNLPRNMSLDVSHFQKFMKRLRKRYGNGIRYYHCGEYGEKFARPHYHACLFNHDFKDKIRWKEVNGNPLWISDELTQLWPFGFSSLGQVSFHSAAYVARYVMKKVTGERAASHYEWVDQKTGEIHTVMPEYTTMSRRPGVGKGWYEKWRDQVYPRDEVVVNGRTVQPPKFYDRMFEVEYPSDFRSVRSRRKWSAKKFADNNTRERLRVREVVTKAKLSRLERSVE